MSTKMVYPVIFHKTKDKVPYFVEVPDLDVMTQGKSIQNAIEMARERICIKVIQLEKEKTKIPNAFELSTIITNDKNAFVSLVDADIEAYKRSMENRCVKKNCTIPGKLNDEAEKAGINFSKVLQKGLMEELRMINGC
ncbi:MAG: type II toxin-antitoxin system HicB family antitoxin [Oscillospiraceae bacterium]